MNLPKVIRKRPEGKLLENLPNLVTVFPFVPTKRGYALKTKATT